MSRKRNAGKAQQDVARKHAVAEVESVNA